MTSAEIVDTHTHVGFSLSSSAKGVGCLCQSLEELRLKMLLHGVDLSIIFPFAELSGNTPKNIRLNNGSSFIKEDFDFQLANLNIINEIIRKHYNMFIPFMMINPSSNVEAIINFYNTYKDYIFGFKIHTKSMELSPVDIIDSQFLNCCETNKLPIIFHTRACDDRYSFKSVLKFAENNPGINVCVAHAAGFDKRFYEELYNFKNVFFDVSPLFSLCYYANQGNTKVISQHHFDADYSDPIKILQYLYSLAPNRILWATDEPCGINNSDTYSLQVGFIKQLHKNIISQIKQNTISFLLYEKI